MANPQPPPAPDEGPSLDLGDLDWTSPPDPTPGGTPWGKAGLGWAAKRYRDASIYAVVSVMLTGLTLGWWLASGRQPAADPSIGPSGLLLHMGAFLTAWLALRASVDTWQVLYLRANAANPPRANLTQIISVGSALVMCFHAAMVVSGILR